MTTSYWIKKALYKLYIGFPLNQLLFSLVKKVKIPSYRLRKYLRFAGVFSLQVSPGLMIKMRSYGNTIENELYWCGLDGWEKTSTDVWKKLCQHSNVIFDIGANTGLYSLIAAKVNPRARIYAFEPMEVMYSRLNKNVKLNGLSVHTMRLALADEDGKGEIYVADTISDTFDQASLNPQKTLNKQRKKIPIIKRKLSGIIEEESIQTVDLMKIDVETFEPQVLRGMGEYLAIFKPMILIEILNDDVGRQVTDIIAGLHYALFQITDTGLMEVSQFSSTRKGSNFLFLNKSKHPFAF